MGFGMSASPHPFKGVRPSTRRTVIRSRSTARVRAAKSTSGKRTVSRSHPLRAKVVDLGPLGGVVLNHDGHLEAKTGHPFQVRKAHQGTPIP